MDDLFWAMSFLCILLCFICIMVLHGNNPLQLRSGIRNIWAIIFYKDIIFIITPVFLLFLFGIDNFSNVFFYVEAEKISRISFYISFCLLLFLIFISIFHHILLSKLNFIISTEEMIKYRKKHYFFSLCFILIGFVLLLFSILFLDYKHATINSLLTGTNLVLVRLSNVYSSSLPTQISYFITMSWWISAIFSSYLWYIKQRVTFIIMFLLGIILATSSGDKAPIIQYILLFMISYLFFYKPKIKTYQLFIGGIGFLFILMLIIYNIVSLQIEELDLATFGLYLLGRLGIGQMAGVYETLSMEFFVENSWWHMVPFASAFVEYPIFSKELMLATENYDYDRIGVKNSFFIAEAFGIGGYLLIFLSPIVVAFSYVLKIIIIFNVLRGFFGIYVAKIYSMPIVFLSSSLTGDFSSFVFQKSTLLIVILLTFVYIIGIPFKMLRKI